MAFAIAEFTLMLITPPPLLFTYARYDSAHFIDLHYAYITAYYS